MKIFVVTVLLLLIAAAAIADADETEEPDRIVNLGVVTPNRGLHLFAGEDRDDFDHFILECLPSTPPTNVITFIHTNSVLSLADLASLPSGRILMSLKSVSVDGTASPVCLYRFRIIRSQLPPPKVQGVKISRDNGEPKAGEGIQQAIQSVIQNRPEPPPPPLPPGIRLQAEKTTLTPSFKSKPPPMPSGTNFSYAQHLDAQAEFYSRQSKK